MKNYSTPKVQVELMSDKDIIATSLGNAENEMEDIFDKEFYS